MELRLIAADPSAVDTECLVAIVLDHGDKQKPAPKGNTTAQTARDMVQTVTNWVNELQQKRRTETTNAIKLMLPENPRTSEA